MACGLKEEEGDIGRDEDDGGEAAEPGGIRPTEAAEGAADTEGRDHGEDLAANEQEADRFESILQSLEIPYEFQIDGFKYSPELKYTFSVA
jgi:hypothetical protein